MEKKYDDITRNLVRTPRIDWNHDDMVKATELGLYDNPAKCAAIRLDDRDDINSVEDVFKCLEKVGGHELIEKIVRYVELGNNLPD